MKSQHVLPTDKVEGSLTSNLPCFSHYFRALTLSGLLFLFLKGLLFKLYVDIIQPNLGTEYSLA
jgi:hypothetical protein